MALRGYQYLDHTADILVHAWAPSFSEAFEEAAKAMFDAMTVIAKIRPHTSKQLQVTGHDQSELLYNWLEELLYIFETQQYLFCDFSVSITPPNEKAEYSQWVLDAEVHGEEFDKVRHLSKVGIKAVTYSHLQIKSSPTQTSLHFLLDI